MIHGTPARWISPSSHDCCSCGLPTWNGSGVRAAAEYQKTLRRIAVHSGLSAGLGEKHSTSKIKVPLARRIRLWVSGSWDCVD